MIVRKVWKNKGNNQLLITIPVIYNIKEGDNVQIVKTEQPVSTKNEIISELILFILNSTNIDKKTFYFKLKNVTTKRQINFILNKLTKDEKIKKILCDNEIYYELLTNVTQ